MTKYSLQQMCKTSLRYLIDLLKSQKLAPNLTCGKYTHARGNLRVKDITLLSATQ
jgi:hypothetical protein